MTKEEIEFHESTIFEEIKIVKKNFFQPLHEVNSVPEIHCDIGILEKVTKIPDGINAYYVTKEVEVNILGSVDGKESLIAETLIIFTFRFANTGNFIEILSAESVKIKPTLSEWLDNIVLATTRGVMFSEFRGTYVGKIILPLITPSQITSKN